VNVPWKKQKPLTWFCNAFGPLIVFSLNASHCRKFLTVERYWSFLRVMKAASEPVRTITNVRRYGTNNRKRSNLRFKKERTTEKWILKVLFPFSLNTLQNQVVWKQFFNLKPSAYLERVFNFIILNKTLTTIDWTSRWRMTERKFISIFGLIWTGRFS
jgi:hypothetical protein